MIFQASLQEIILPDFWKKVNIPANIYLFKVNYRSNWENKKICSKLTIKAFLLRYFSIVYIVNFEELNVFTFGNKKVKVTEKI